MTSITQQDEDFLKEIFPAVWIDNMIENGDFVKSTEEVEDGN